MNSFAQDLPTPAPGKSLIIFMGPSPGALVGLLLKFEYFDSTQYLGKIGPAQYLAYECNPGRHLFWGEGGSQDFLEADLAADQVYIVNASATGYMGATNIKLLPFDPNGKKADKKRDLYIRQIVRRKEVKIDSGIEVPKWILRSIDVAMRNYARKKAKNRRISVLTADMHI